MFVRTSAIAHLSLRMLQWSSGVGNVCLVPGLALMYVVCMCVCVCVCMCVCACVCTFVTVFAALVSGIGKRVGQGLALGQ